MIRYVSDEMVKLHWLLTRWLMFWYLQNPD